MCKSNGLEIFVLPLKCSNILQQLDKAIFCSMKRESSRQKDGSAGNNVVTK